MAKRMTYWATTGLVVVVFFATGIGSLIPISHIARDMAHLGYPPYFHTILGTWKILGAIAIALPRMPRLKEWAYAGMIFDLTGAAFSRLASGDDAMTIMIPLAIACFVAISWLFRSHNIENQAAKILLKR